MGKQLILTGTPWEPLIGYSRAVRIGPFVHVSGTMATDQKGQLVGVGDVYAQTVQILHNIKEALSKAGAKMEEVVRTHLFVTDIREWEKIGKSHGEVFKAIRPSTGMLKVRGFLKTSIGWFV